DFLLSSHPKATAALDLLLGTQGWRRFAEQNVEQFREKNGDDADRYLVSIGQSFMQASNYDMVAHTANAQLASEWETKRREFVKSDAEVREELKSTRAEYSKLIESASPAIGGFTRELRATENERRTALDRLADYNESWRLITLAVVGGLLLAIG